MIETISVRLDEKLIKEVENIEDELKTDRSEVIRRLLDQSIKEWKIKRVIELLRKGEISIGKAAELAGITLYEMIKIADDSGILIGYSEKDLAKDVKRFSL